MRRKNYFPADPGDPEPLTAQCTRRVRFEEVDALRIMWHGRYPSYFEDGRRAFGETYRMGYLDFKDHGYVVPLVQWHADYFKPLEFQDLVTITIRCHWTRAARINFTYELSTEEKGVTATGYSVQVFQDLTGEAQILPPPFWEEFLEKWSDR